MAEKQDNCKRQDGGNDHNDVAAPLSPVVYRKAGPGGTVEFRPALPIGQPGKGARPGGREPLTKDRARAWKLLKAIKRAPRRQGQLGKDRVAGQLSAGTRIYAALAESGGAPARSGRDAEVGARHRRRHA